MLARTLALAFALTLTLLSGCAPPWSGGSSALPAPYFRANDLSMDSPTDGWAVGWWVTTTLSPAGTVVTTQTPTLAHDQQGRWTLAPTALPAGQVGELVRMLSPTDGWATFRYLPGIDLFYHYDGQRWLLASPVPDPASSAPNTVITDLQVLPSGIGWAVGPRVVMQLAHGVWTNVTSALPPRPTDWEADWIYPGMHSVSVVSASDAWATGDGGSIWHYDGVGWRMATSPYFPTRYYTSPSVNGYVASPAELAKDTLEAYESEALYATQLLSPTQGWSIGGTNPLVVRGEVNWGPGVVEHDQNGSWQVVHTTITGTSTDRLALFTLAMTAADDGWVGGAWYKFVPIGAGDAASVYVPRVDKPLLLHDQAGQWVEVTVPNVGAIHRLVMLSPEDGWAAADGGLLHYSGGQWLQVAVHSHT
jgi:hypothetical protein